MSKTVEFLGKRYPLKDAERNILKGLCVFGPDCSGMYDAYAKGRLCQLATRVIGSGTTPQKAVNSLERSLFSNFAELGALLGWEVER